MRKYTVLALIVVALMGAPTPPAFGVSKETLQMMQQLDALQSSIQNLQKTVDTQSAVLKTLVEQSNDNVNSMKAIVTDLRGALQQSLAASGAKSDSMTSQIQALSESLDEAKARLTKLGEQITQIQNTLTTLPANPTAPTPGTSPTGAATPGAPPVPTADSLFTQGQTYYMGGQYDLAMQSFQDYLKYYSDTDRASNAQFYIGECYYNQKGYKDAISAYDLCIEKYPGGNRVSAAQLHKAYSLLALDEKTAGIRELRSLVQRAPDTVEADQARQRLKKMGVAATAPAPVHRKP